MIKGIPKSPERKQTRRFHSLLFLCGLYFYMVKDRFEFMSKIRHFEIKFFLVVL